MSEKVNGAPKSTETQIRLNSGQEAQPSEPREYFQTATEYFSDIDVRRNNATGNELKTATAEYNACGGSELDQLRTQLANDPDNALLKKQVEQKETTVYESYLNRNNEFAQLSKEDRGEVVNTIASEMPAENDPKYFQKLLELEKSLVADGGITRSQVQYVFTEAAVRNEHLVGVRANEAPTGLPTTAELKKNEGKLNWRQKARRLLGMPAVYAGLGIASLIDASQRRNEKYQKKSVQQEGETKEQYEKRLRKYDRNVALGAVAIGAAVIGLRALTKSEAFDGLLEGGPNKPEVVTLTPEGGADSTTDTRGELDQYGRHMDDDTPEAEGIQTETEGSSEFTYNAAEDPFYDENKTGVNNYGAPLEADPEFDVEGVPGTAELRDSLIDSPNQLAVASAEMMQEGFSRDNLDGMGMELMNNPDFAEMSYDQIAAILDNPETKFSNGVLESGTYGSYYQYEVDGQLYNAYDPTVNEDATTIIVDWKDANGEWHRTEFKRECGGQIIHRHPVAESSAPIGGAEYVPQTVTTEYVPPVTYTENPPQGGGNPPADTPPVNPPVNPPEGGGTPPPTILEPKDVAADINANSDLPGYLQMGDQAGTIQSGELDTKPVAPPVEYTPDPAPNVSTEITNGAAPNDRTEAGGGTPEVVVPVPEAGVSGEAPTDVVTDRVEG